MSPAQREVIESEIERLIGILDTIDPDPDLEPNLGLSGYPCCADVNAIDLEGDGADDEPSLGWTEMEARFGRHPDVLGNDTELDTSDDEPSLGSGEVQMPAPLYQLGGGHGHCLFPALYRESGTQLQHVAVGFTQSDWGAGSRDDREDEHDGREPCCEDEGAQSDDEGFQCGY